VALRFPRFGTGSLICLIAAALLFAASSSQSQAQAAARPFDGMAGTWSGTGTVTLGSGERERIRCRVTYAVGQAGTQVEQDLRCASDSYKFELQADITFANGYVTGRWNERTQRTSGTISGRASPGTIEALAETSGFAAFFTMITRGESQSVKIESKSKEITEVSITLRRTGR
jgi:hypothetical protein